MPGENPMIGRSSRIDERMFQEGCLYGVYYLGRYGLITIDDRGSESSDLSEDTAWGEGPGNYSFQRSTSMRPSFVANRTSSTGLLRFSLFIMLDR